MSIVGCDRIPRLKLLGRKQKTYLYSAYAPTAVSLRNDREPFFSYLQNDIQSLPARDVVVIDLDANAMLLVGDQSNKVKFSPIEPSFD